MTVELERYLWERIRHEDEPWEEGKLPRYVIEQMLDAGMIHSPKQAWRTLEKWNDVQVYTYGTTLDLGWRLQWEFPRVNEQIRECAGEKHVS